MFHQAIRDCFTFCTLFRSHNNCLTLMEFGDSSGIVSEIMRKCFNQLEIDFIKVIVLRDMKTDANFGLIDYIY